jgi:hypothetical protein
LSLVSICLKGGERSRAEVTAHGNKKHVATFI